MKRLLLAGLIVISILLQVGLLPALRPFGVVPNLMLVMVALVGLEGSASLGLVVAVLAGLVVDFASGADFGLRTAIYVLVALTCGLMHRAGLELTGPLLALGLVAGGTILLATVILLGVAGSVSGTWPVGSLLGRVALELVLNLSLVIALRPLVTKCIPERPGRGSVIG